MSFFTYLIPRYIASFSSPYNPSIRIFESNNTPSLFVGGSPQSGEYIDKLWKSVFHHFDIGKLTTIKKILVLGVGGGTVISMVSNMFPAATIIGVDIDETMLHIAKRYFHVDTIPKVTLVCHDAKEYIEVLKKHHEQFDFIIVDIFSGRHIPSFVSNISFLAQIRYITTPHGLVCINYLQELEYNDKSELLKSTLLTLSSNVREYKKFFNRFFLYHPHSEI